MNERRPGAVHADFPDVDDSEEDLYVIEIEKRHYLEGCLRIQPAQGRIHIDNSENIPPEILRLVENRTAFTALLTNGNGASHLS